MSGTESARARLKKMRDEGAAQEVVQTKPAKKPSGAPSLELQVALCDPNEWNPNIVEKQQMVKLKAGIKMLLDQGTRPPPIVVRNVAGGRFQIIDGFHRWSIFKDLKQETIPGFVLDVDDKTARILTNTLNYLRGQPNETKYSELIADLINSHGAEMDELAGLLPETRDELTDILAESDAGIRSLMMIEEKERLANKDVDDAIDDDALWLDVTFRVSKSQANVIEREVSRIEATLDGKNRRGRALEYMAAMSSTTPLVQEPKAAKKAANAAKKAKKEAEAEE